MAYTTQQAARLLSVHPATINRLIRRYVAETGSPPPGMDEHRLVSDEFFDWFHARPEARPKLQGKLRGGCPRAVRDVAPNVNAAQSLPRQGHVTPHLVGLTPASRLPDADELWKRVIDMQAKDAKKVDCRYDQRVEIPDSKPVLLVLLGDIHLGNRHCAFAQARADAELVRDTPGVYGAVLGDVFDNWITPKVVGIQREQPVSYQEELMLMASWFQIMKDKLVAVVSGNHDLRSYEMAGFDVLQHVLQDVKTLYDQHEIRFTLRLGSASWRWKLRHSWVRKSQYNPTHGIEWDSKFNDGSWQFGVGGHWHGPTVLRSFVDVAHDGQLKLAVQLGSYELDSPYARKLNLGRAFAGGSAGLMLWPDGSYQPWQDLGAAVRFLAAERARSA